MERIVIDERAGVESLSVGPFMSRWLCPAYLLCSITSLLDLYLTITRAFLMLRSFLTEGSHKGQTTSTMCSKT